MEEKETLRYKCKKCGFQCMSKILMTKHCKDRPECKLEMEKTDFYEEN